MFSVGFHGYLMSHIHTPTNDLKSDFNLWLMLYTYTLTNNKYTST